MTFSERITVVSHISTAGPSKLVRISSSVSVRMLQFMQKVHNALFQRTFSQTNLVVSRAFAAATSGSLDLERDNGSKVQTWIDTLDPLLKRKIHYIQNEVSISLHLICWHFFGAHHTFHLYVYMIQVAVRSFGSEFPIDADTLTVTDYQTLLTKSNRDRHRYYNYLYKNRLEEKEKNVSFAKLLASTAVQLSSAIELCDIPGCVCDQAISHRARHTKKSRRSGWLGGGPHRIWPRKMLSHSAHLPPNG